MELYFHIAIKTEVCKQTLSLA